TLVPPGPEPTTMTSIMRARGLPGDRGAPRPPPAGPRRCPTTPDTRAAPAPTWSAAGNRPRAWEWPREARSSRGSCCGAGRRDRAARRPRPAGRRSRDGAARSRAAPRRARRAARARAHGWPHSIAPPPSAPACRRRGSGRRCAPRPRAPRRSSRAAEPEPEEVAVLVERLVDEVELRLAPVLALHGNLDDPATGPLGEEAHLDDVRRSLVDAVREVAHGRDAVSFGRDRVVVVVDAEEL